MAKMREVKVTKPGTIKAAKPSKYTSYFNAEGVKVTVCNTTFAAPKQLTARC